MDLNEETATNSLPVQYGNSVTIYIKSEGEIVTDESAKLLNFNQRGCSLPGELIDKMAYYPVYSRSACLIECEYSKQMNTCNCSQHQLIFSINSPREQISTHSNGNFQIIILIK